MSSDVQAEHGDDEVVSQWMSHLAALPLEQPATLDPAAIWWKAQLLRRWDHERQAVAPIEVGERIQVGVGLVGTVGAVAWLWPAIAVDASSLPLSLLLIAGIVLMGIAAASTFSGLRPH